MIQVRKSNDRGLANHGWLNSKHTFSFADYYDDKHMGFSVLRVINEDRIEGGTGFATHGHRDMEIISYVIDGALEHKDSMGSNTIIEPGEVQRMSAGTGVRHSEYNHLKDRATHFLQVWILPAKQGDAPSYDQKSFRSDFATGGLRLVGSRDGRNGSVVINQDVDLYAAKSPRAGETEIRLQPGRRAWVQVVKGEVGVGVIKLGAGDGAGVVDDPTVKLSWSEGSEFLVFDLP